MTGAGERLEREVAATRDAAVAEALSELDARRPVDDDERAAIESLADRLVASVMAGPLAAVGDEGSDEDFPDETVLSLFDLEDQGDQGDHSDESRPGSISRSASTGSQRQIAGDDD